MPTLIAHGDDDQVVPIDASALLSAKLVKDATLKIYKGGPHGLATTRADEFNADLLEFIQTQGRGASPHHPRGRTAQPLGEGAREETRPTPSHSGIVVCGVGQSVVVGRMDSTAVVYGLQQLCAATDGRSAGRSTVAVG